MLEGLPKAYFTEENSADVVTSQNVNADDTRLREVMNAITRHLHAAIKEIEPTQEEWMKAIMFLTETGHKCDDWRQEFILLLDKPIPPFPFFLVLLGGGRWVSRSSNSSSLSRR